MSTTRKKEILDKLKTKSEAKIHMNLVVIGHVDAGKVIHKYSKFYKILSSILYIVYLNGPSFIFIRLCKSKNNAQVISYYIFIF